MAVATPGRFPILRPMQALGFVLVLAFSLLGFRPAAMPVATGDMPAAMEAHHEHGGGSSPAPSHHETCLFCVIVAGAALAAPASLPVPAPARASRLARCRRGAQARPQPVRSPVARGPPAPSGSPVTRP